MDNKTTSYELSLKLKELGAVQEGGQFYWRNPVYGDNIFVDYETNCLAAVFCQSITLQIN